MSNEPAPRSWSLCHGNPEVEGGGGSTTLDFGENVRWNRKPSDVILVSLSLPGYNLPLSLSLLRLGTPFLAPLHRLYLLLQ